MVMGAGGVDQLSAVNCVTAFHRLGKVGAWAGGWVGPREGRREGTRSSRLGIGISYALLR